MLDEPTSTARPGPPHWRLRIRHSAVTLTAGPRTVAEGPGADVPFSLAETVQALRRAYEAAGRGTRRRATGLPTPVLMRRLGGLLAEAAGPPVVRALSAAAQGKAAQEHGLPLVIEAERGRLDGLPWEALTLPGQSAPLALHPTVRPYRSFGDRLLPASAGRPDQPLRLVVLLAGPRQAPGRREPLLDLDAETARLAAAVSGIPSSADLRVLSSGSLTALGTALRERPADVVHIVCHARAGELLLEDEAGQGTPVGADALCRTLLGAGSVPMVVLAGCSTAASVRPSPAGSAHHSRFLPGLAQSLVESGAPAVVAMSAPVRDTYAGALMADMYAGLAMGQPVWEALHDARTEQERLRRVGNDWLPEWHVPLLFAGPSRRRVQADRGGTSTRVVAPESPLALPLGSFVGRRAQLRTALNALADERTALVVHGVGGVGKTAFVGEVLRLRGGSATPVLLRGPVGPEEILHGAAEVLAGEAADTRAPELSDPNRPWSARLALLGDLVNPDAAARATSDRGAHPTASDGAARLTVVLDDFEANLTRDPYGRIRFTDPELADFIAAWSALPTNASLVIASRHPLPAAEGKDFRGFHQLSLPPLTPDETDLMRLRLPLSRRLPRWKWREIRQVVGGHPRTYAYLEALLGAGRATDELAERIGRLGGGIDAVRARVRGELRPAVQEALSLTAADTLLDDLLSTLGPASRHVLHCAAVHRMPVPASAFTDPDDGRETRERLDALTASGLLAEDGADPDGTPLWSVHRWTAAELDRLHPDVAEEAHRRAATYTEAVFSDTALPEPVRVDAAFESLHHLSSVRLHREAAALGHDLCRLLHAMGRWATERALCGRMLAWSEPGTESEAFVHRQLGLIARDRGDTRQAREHMERALAVSTAAGDSLGVAFAEHQLGSIELNQGDHRAAGARYRRARAAFGESGRERDAAAALYELSLLSQYEGRPAEAKAGFEEAKEVLARFDDLGGVSACHRSLAYLAEDEGDLDTAMAHCRTALALCRSTGDVAQTEVLRNQIGTLYVLREDYPAAHAEFDAALRSAVARDAPEDIARSHQHLGVCAERMGALDIAEEHTRAALELNRDLERVAAQAQCLRRLGALARLRGRPTDGLSYGRRALALLARTDETGDRPDICLTIGDCLRDLGRVPEARRFYTSGLRDARTPVLAERARSALRKLDGDGS